MTDEQVQEPVTETVPRLIFRAGGTRCSLPVQEVERIVSAPAFELFTIPLADRRVAGLISLDGQPVAVLRFPCFAPDEALHAESAYIVADAGGQRFSFLADAVLSVENGGPAEGETALDCAALLEMMPESGALQ